MFNATATRTAPLTNLRRANSFAERATLVAAEPATHTAMDIVVLDGLLPTPTVAPCAAATAPVPGATDAADAPMAAAFLATLDDVTADLEPIACVEIRDTIGRDGTWTVANVRNGWAVAFRFTSDCYPYAPRYAVWDATGTAPRFHAQYGVGDRALDAAHKAWWALTD